MKPDTKLALDYLTAEPRHKKNSYSEKNFFSMRKNTADVILLPEEISDEKIGSFIVILIFIKNAYGVMFLTIPFYFRKIGFIGGSVIPILL